MTRLTALIAALGATAVLVAGCGRPLPEDSTAPVPEQGDPTGAFGGEGDGLEGTIRVAGSASGVPLVRTAATGFRAEEPGIRVTVRPAAVDDAVAALCAGRLDVAVADRAITASERTGCEREADGAVELHVADASGRPVDLVTTNAVLFERFEVEGLLQYTLDDAERLARDAGLTPLSVDELDETQTVFERALAGI